MIFHFSNAVERDPAVGAWLKAHPDTLGAIAQHWFDVMRACGDDVRELLHDGHPTACVTDAAFAYVDAFQAHVNVGFYRGAELADPARLLQGAGKYMRHVKLRPDSDVDAAALTELIASAYADMKQCLGPTRGMNAELEVLVRFRELCLRLPETSETGSWGHPNFRAGKRTFAAFEWVENRPSLAFKLGADEVDALLLQKGGQFFTTPYGRGQWVSLWGDRAVDWPRVQALVEQSFRTVALKRMLAALDTQREPAAGRRDDDRIF